MWGPENLLAKGAPMQEAVTSNEKDFPEWMVTRALASYLGAKGSENAQRMAWLFSLEAETAAGGRQLSRLCGFDWTAGEVEGGPEESFKDTPGDRGKMSAEGLKGTYWTITPDFRYWTKSGEKQLIVEAKGTQKPIGQRDLVQAKRYFSYLRSQAGRGR
jgi:hypothetical protein